MKENQLQTITNLFKNNEVRSVWDKEKEDYFFSVVDVISALTNSTNPKRYWTDLRMKLNAEGSELYEKIVQLKLVARDDIEKKLGRTIISNENKLNYEYKTNKKLKQ